MKVEKFVTSTEVVDLKIIGITLLSEADYVAFKGNIKSCGKTWWLKTAYDQYDGKAYAKRVEADGSISVRDVEEYHTFVRPALMLGDANKAYCKIGDKFLFADDTYTIISNELALCDDTLGQMAFGADKNDRSASNYERSYIKAYLDEWFAFYNKEN